MLTVYFKNEPDKLPKDLELVTDVDREYMKFQVFGTDEERKLIRAIDRGEYKNVTYFVDRFGGQVYLDLLSTGCKAGIVVSNNPDKLIDLVECGFNARDAIISICKNGNVIVESDEVLFDESDNEAVEIRVDNYIFSNIKRLNYYLANERWAGYKLSNMEGVKYV